MMNYVLRSVVLDEPLSSSSTYNQGVEIEKSVNIDLNALEQFNIDYSANNTAELGNGNGMLGKRQYACNCHIFIILIPMRLFKLKR